ncbi:hypothetical protein [Streptomyces natalensis]|uniref:LPXTG-domain-containing protein cell wall anchor domain protein n=1 Tax=Streptomyces natalensis ATCC 27448 TaxID=1240678 RepID=A0A0D7CG54_9ACTN|nr:hypothetical protein [Streptomyces natalensis]KIZ14407.1 hypothetical protein SNA_35540 [Streptomyces natalensis ATCC 27448]
MEDRSGSARRPLLTAVAAASVLGALWFVPSAHASADEDGPPATSARTAPAVPRAAAAGAAGATGPGLAASGGPDVTPYALGGSVLLALGAGLVAHSVRRSHGEAT